MPKLRKPKATVAPAPRRPPPRMEYRAGSDEAWYGARVAVQDGYLRVMFEDFLEDADEWYDPDAPELASPRAAVDALRARFRRPCPALDDARCGDLRPGDQLCLTCDMHGGEIKYYDAVLEAVEKAPWTARSGARAVSRCDGRRGGRRGGLLRAGVTDPRFGEGQGEATAASQEAADGTVSRIP
ncbi:unnamed protein product [Triticum turgidum subsp. durum]|uniref:SAWADEE domain-containing protein n=1 Tax=Triticum turgidum subsp. durum TaxID=4567 RepID=A0A9R0ZLX1_TRITD|nr:unnamed protein product [Triticum turgidum subsp. durum]